MPSGGSSMSLGFFHKPPVILQETTITRQSTPVDSVGGKRAARTDFETWRFYRTYLMTSAGSISR
jgi:hypothetical protein